MMARNLTYFFPPLNIHKHMQIYLKAHVSGCKATSTLPFVYRENVNFVTVSREELSFFLLAGMWGVGCKV